MTTFSVQVGNLSFEQIDVTSVRLPDDSQMKYAHIAIEYDEGVALLTLNEEDETKLFEKLKERQLEKAK